MTNPNELKCPFCQENNDFCITKQDFSGHVYKKDTYKDIGISAHLYVLKCGKCSTFISIIPKELIKANDPRDQDLLDKLEAS
jgi:hypothetical protein